MFNSTITQSEIPLSHKRVRSAMEGTIGRTEQKVCTNCELPIIKLPISNNQPDSRNTVMEKKHITEIDRLIMIAEASYARLKEMNLKKPKPLKTYLNNYNVIYQKDPEPFKFITVPRPGVVQRKCHMA